MAVRNLVVHGLAYGKAWLVTHGLGGFGPQAPELGTVALAHEAIGAVSLNDAAVGSATLGHAARGSVVLAEELVSG